MKRAELALRKEIIAACQWMNSSGLNQGTSGNISVRFEDRMLITPSAVAYETMTPEMIASLPFDAEYGTWEGPMKPSTEWRFHFDIMKARDDDMAIVHAHPTFCTALAMTRRGIPAAHYMIAAFGGTDVRCSGYATFGTAALSKEAIAALDGRKACLLANHGSIATGESLDKALWRANELETIARQYVHALQIGGPVILSDAEIADTAKGFGSYGVQDKPATKKASSRSRSRLQAKTRVQMGTRGTARSRRTKD